MEFRAIPHVACVSRNGTTIATGKAGFMRTHIRLFRIFDIEVGLHYSWFLIALLITLSLAGFFTASHPEWGRGVIWALATLTSLLFFLALVLHELSHALVAQARNLPVRSITLFALGGIAQIEKGAADARTEFFVAIVGPITSFLIGLVCWGLALAAGWGGALDAGTPAQAMLVWLGYINFALALFNMVPGYPLDGGRVLRALIWWKTGDADKSTRIAARAGQGVGFLLIGFGLLRFFSGAGFGGLWMAFIGWFLVQVAGESYNEVGVRNILRDVRVADIMTRDCVTVEPGMDLRTFVDETLLRTGRRCFLVQKNGHVEGLLTPHDVKQVDREAWPSTLVAEVMRPLGEVRAVSPETPVTEALEMMARNDVNQLPVVSEGHVDGMVSRGQVLRMVQTRSELGA